MESIERLLSTWVSALDSQIGDTDAEIARRRESQSTAVLIRDDLRALIKYMDEIPMPEPARRALGHCLSWNPHTGARS